METNLVIEGFKFMGLGMGTVFVFLGIMIVAMNIMSTIIHKFFPEPQPKASTSAPSSNAKKQDNNKKIVAAITAAIKHHREG
ncbi:MAG: OadG family protein [Campylobacterales bacterium]|nr:OadG family protein [Campylobacterales bacterium]